MRDHAGPDITIRTGSGTGRTLLSAFDDALWLAGVANFNLITLSSVIPPRSRVRVVADQPLAGGHGDRLHCVLSTAYADHPGEIVWAGLGWTFDEQAGGLFVEHHGGSEESLLEQIELSLADMGARRGGAFGPVQTVTTSAHCVDRPVCALAVAAYEVTPWGPGA
ncbi:pyruvoyl-dependent arginine decarboxylase [Nocardioides sp. MAHUQ-72]|uniref:pyruvoyl-dependent arginine decarboxylase n=1 Tax=unclassified Nocardioides TaxID=2615069 RepID=UPI00361E754F